MDLTTDSLQNLGATLSRQIAHAHKNQRLTNAAITFLLNLILSQSEYVDASSQILQFKTQLRQLIAGQLPRTLITPEMLQDVMKNISAFLQKYDVPLHLPDRPIFDLYKNPNFVLSRQDNKIIISLKFPLSLTSSSLTLYKVTALRLPTDAQNQHVSFIQNLPSFIAYEETEPWYLELPHYPILDNEIYYIERHFSVLKHRCLPTCIIALLEGGTESIQKLCKFVIQPYAAKEEILILGPGQLLLQFVKQYTLTCQNITQTYNASTNYQVLTMCYFKSGIIQYFSKIAHCAKDTVTEPKTQYAVNVNLLYHYFNASELIPDNQQLLDSMPEILLPNLTFQERELTE
jgi:hypothetical protein